MSGSAIRLTWPSDFAAAAIWSTVEPHVPPSGVVAPAGAAAAVLPPAAAVVSLAAGAAELDELLLSELPHAATASAATTRAAEIFSAFRMCFSSV